eukprot:COSAG01_NODE_4248_length_5208_cov_15.724408_6_plen_69_part_00
MAAGWGGRAAGRPGVCVCTLAVAIYSQMEAHAETCTYVRSEPQPAYGRRWKGMWARTSLQSAFEREVC